MPETPRMSDDEFRQLVMRALGEHDTRLTTHEASMARMDRNYDKLVEIQLEHAARQDAHERIMDMMRVTLDAIKDILRDRRN